MLRILLTSCLTEFTRTPDGGITTTIVELANWRLRDVGGMLRIAIETEPLSVEMATRIGTERPVSPAGEPPVNQVQADADNGRISQGLTKQ